MLPVNESTRKLSSKDIFPENYKDSQTIFLLNYFALLFVLLRIKKSTKTSCKYFLSYIFSQINSGFRYRGNKKEYFLLVCSEQVLIAVLRLASVFWRGNGTTGKIAASKGIMKTVKVNLNGSQILSAKCNNKIRCFHSIRK